MRIPEQPAVVSFDDMPMAAIADPPRTTVRQPLEAIASEALRLATQETLPSWRGRRRCSSTPR